jgi:transcriptional regulator with GAF, ATPase, and Fis domain
VAPTESTVLIQGDSGTGKEVIARYIHGLSPRSEGPFVSINCGALPESLLESELFGHVKGSFTGAVRDNEGLFAAARGGTFFLDEVGDTTPGIQVKLLRVLQEREVIPVGGTEPVPVDVRLIAATNRDLDEEIRAGRFRSDLFYRLNVIAIHLPPLRTRRDDIALLAEGFLHRVASERKEELKVLAPDALDAILVYDWPGNVRELENLIHRELLLADGEEIRLESLQPQQAAVADESDASPAPLTQRSFREAKACAVDAFERAYIAELLTRANGNVSLAARLAGKERSRLGKLLRKHGLCGAAFRDRNTDSSH